MDPSLLQLSKQGFARHLNNVYEELKDKRRPNSKYESSGVAGLRVRNLHVIP